MDGELFDEGTTLAPGLDEMWRGLAQLALMLADVQQALSALGFAEAAWAPSTEEGAWLRAYA